MPKNLLVLGGTGYVAKDTLEREPTLDAATRAIATIVPLCKYSAIRLYMPDVPAGQGVSEVVLGRGEALKPEYRFSNPKLSSSHCKVTVSAEGHVLLQDLSKNGTFVNGVLIPRDGDKQQRLFDSDTVSLLNPQNYTGMDNVEFLLRMIFSERADDDEVEEDEEPVKAKKAPAKASGKKRKKEEEEDEDEDEEPPSKKLQKVAQPEGGRRGAVDRELPGGGSGAAIHEGWTAMLNQTNIGGGANKFYIIQLVKLSNGKFGVWNRWGRVGERGWDNGLKTYPFLGAAQADFKKKFKDKIRNDFESTVLKKTSEFKKVPGKYGLVEVDEDDEVGGQGPSVVALRVPEEPQELNFGPLF